jgi:hypothetical protein
MAVDISNAVRLLESYGFIDVLLPFFLIFTILYVIIGKVSLFKGSSKFAGVISTILSILVVAPHVTGNYPVGFDPINIINQTLPSLSIMIIAIVFLLVLLGMMGKGLPSWINSGFGFFALSFIVYIFGTSLGWWAGPADFNTNFFSWWSDDLTTLLIVLLVFGLIGKFITDDRSGDKKKEDATKRNKAVGDFFKGIFGGGSGGAGGGATPPPTPPGG